MVNNRFIYDEKTSSLYAPDGTFLKKVFCPKAKQWNQLIVQDGEDRWRGCEDCRERVINLDKFDPSLSTLMIKANQQTCIYAPVDTDKIIFLKDAQAIEPPQAFVPGSYEKTVIKTVWGLEDINRGAAMGYWPDVHLVKYDIENLRGQISVGQDLLTGKVTVSEDFRHSFSKPGKDPYLNFGSISGPQEIVPFTGYYPYHKESPIAAYLIPNDLRNGASVFIPEPIEDMVGAAWQASTERASDVYGQVLNKKIILDKSSVKKKMYIG